MCNDGLRCADKMQALIQGWRGAWNEKLFPFYYVQIGPYEYTRRKDKLAHTKEALRELWEAQACALEVPNTGMIPTTDLVDNLHNIHPKNKREVGKRLANLALTMTYNQKGLTHAGPTFQKAETKDSDIILHFNNASDDLVSRDERPLTDFEIAGADGNLMPATATIAGDTVIVSGSDVSAPVAGPFAWGETSQPSLFNKEGWPAYPFRTNGPIWTPAPSIKPVTGAQ
jgi:sialate O-acetylesterase